MFSLMLILVSEPAYIMAQVVDTSQGLCEINRGTQWGIVKGKSVGFYDAWNTGKIWAVGVVDSAESLRAFVRPKYSRRPGPGELVQVKVELKGSDWNTDPILGLGRLYITLKDDSGHIIFFPDDVLEQDSAWRTQLLKDLVKAARAMAEYTKDITLANGDSLSTLLAGTTTRDVLDFLQFVVDFPAGYMGREIPFAAAYATWLKNGSPPSGKRLASMLETADQEQRDYLISKYEKELPVALDWLVRQGKKQLALDIARSTGDNALIKLVQKARIGN